MTCAESPVAVNDMWADVRRPARLSSLPDGIFKARNSPPASQMLSNCCGVFRGISGSFAVFRDIAGGRRGCAGEPGDGGLPGRAGGSPELASGIRLAERETAVDMNHLPRDVSSFVRQKKRDQRGDIGRFCYTAERCRFGGAIPYRSIIGSWTAIFTGIAGRNAIDRDAVRLRF
jgi:hypothetical protein